MRERAASMAIAFGVGSLAGIDFLPAIGIDVFPPATSPSSPSSPSPSHAIRRYQLVDLTPEYAASQILATMKGAVIVVDLDGNIRVANRAASMMLGYRADQRSSAQHLQHDPAEGDVT